MKQKWMRRHFIRASIAPTQLAFFRNLFGISRSDRDSLFDQSGAKYLRGEPGAYLVSEQRRLPFSMCERQNIMLVPKEIRILARHRIERGFYLRIQWAIPGLGRPQCDLTAECCAPQLKLRFPALSFLLR